MRVTWIIVLAALVGLQNFCESAPLTKWFKTDNATYYIETEQKFNWQQSYAECKSRNLNLLTLKQFNGDEILNQYLKQSFDPIPEFWLRSDIAVDLTNIIPSLTEEFFKIKMEDVEEADVLHADNPNNCVLTKDGSAKACDITHGFICKTSSNDCIGGQNIQNIVLKFA
ncbi:uncharacterized protein LOC101898207 [Musca domestica]|uniref:Uncharacterized protein LOC101898207 n=1 Tax=Musca domestica TaxID=7370 RepID=A0A1I8MH68_MUSDO|nr:uncharacterized protein LOC101898207 [Musca domestica]